MRIALIAVSLVLGACRFALPFPGGGLGHTTLVENASPNGYVVSAVDDVELRYYALPPKSVAIIDTVGEANLAIRAMTLYDEHCDDLQVQHGGFESGAHVVIHENGGVSVTSPYSIDGGDERVGAAASCELAASGL